MARIVLLVLTYVWIVAQILGEGSSQSLDIKNFRCNNGKYIKNHFFCDRDMQDCGDSGKSDESAGCSEVCGAGKFYCGSGGPCLNITKRCNTIPECPDGSDELNCGIETDIDHCSIFEGRYLCQDRLKCLDLNITCDRACNCLDCSDESAYCGSLGSVDACYSCAANCLPNSNGKQCVCNSGQYAMSKFCTDNFSSTNGQLCIRYRNVSRCQCDVNYHEIYQRDGITCRHNAWLQMLIYSTPTKIKMLNVTTSLTKIIQDDVNCTILTAAKEYFYYVIHRDKKEYIFKSLINGRKSEKVIELDSTIDSLAVDWISSKLYFTSDKSLLVCSSDGRICTRLKCCGIDYVALAPKFGWMFYVYKEMEDGERFIKKSNMDGSEETIFVDMSFRHPISLAVDEWTEIVYCFEREVGMYSFSLNGSSEMVHSLNGQESFSYHFSAFENQLFFIKENGNTIYNTMNLTWNHFSAHTDKRTNTIRSLFAYDPVVQITYGYGTENPCTTESCNGLCLLRSASNTNVLNYTCMCQNFTPLDDNSSWCGDRPNRSVLRFKSSTKNEAPQIDSFTRPMPTSILKNDVKPPAVLSSPLEQTSFERYPATGYFNNIMFCMTFALGVLMLYLLNRINHSIQNRRTITSGELIEL